MICPSVPAADPIDWKPNQAGGLNVSLATSGYRFPAVVPGVQTAAKGKSFLPAPVVRTSFVASVCLSNRGRQAVPFTFNDGGPRWTFRILDAQDEEIWNSNDGIASPQVITEETLEPGRSWKMSFRIPLVVDETPLAAGVYTVQAFLNADKSVSATSPFQVVAAPGAPTGIRGLVLREGIIEEVHATFAEETPAVGVQVTVSEILTSPNSANRLPFSWTGTTNAEGRFVLNAPPGRYRVTAYDRTISLSGQTLQVITLPIHLPVLVATDTVEVTVQQGALSDVTLHLKRNASPSITQGIRGSVNQLVFPTEPDEAITNNTGSVPNPSIISLGRYMVRVTQLDVPEGSTPFVGTVMTNFRNEFQIATPPGRFQVYATETIHMLMVPLLGFAPPSASAIVMVEPNSVPSVSLILSQGCVINGPQ